MALAFLLLGALFIKHWVANYPLLTSYTAQGLSTTDGNGWIKPMLARAGIHAALTAGIVVLFSIFSSLPLNIPALICVAAIDLIAHLVLDRAKVDPELLGQFQVASAAELAQIQIDYTSKSPAVVAAAQAKSQSNLYFWWGTGLIYVAYSLVYIEMARILTK